MTAIVERPDLSKRTALSKSALSAFDICQYQAWHDLHFRLPLIPQERITFGSALDAAVEVVISFLRMDQPVEFERADAAAAEIVERDGVDVDLDEVGTATRRFVPEVAQHYDFRLARLQESLRAAHEDFGPLDGHPDVILADGRIFDVKSSAKPKPAEPSVELGFYALLLHAAEGVMPTEVGYWTWVRIKRPYWQVATYPVNDELLRWTVERAAAYVRAKRTDERMNAKAPNPQNWSMTGGPKFGNKSCLTCQYSPMCPIAYRGESVDDAA